MDGTDIVALCVGLVLELPLIGLILHKTVDETRHTLWPPGLRWLPPAWDRLEDRAECLLRPERRFLFTPRRIRHLEELDERFRSALELYGVWPEWTGRDDVHGHWVAYGRETDTCPCGYVIECAIWCGDGHEDGTCPTHGDPLAGSGGRA